MEQHVAEVMMAGLQRAYEDRTAHVGRALQRCVEALPADAVLQQLAKDSDSAIHIGVHVEGVIRSCLKRDAEQAVSRALQACAKAEARAEQAERCASELRDRLAGAKHDKAQSDILHLGTTEQLRREIDEIRHNRHHQHHHQQHQHHHATTTTTTTNRALLRDTAAVPAPQHVNATLAQQLLDRSEAAELRHTAESHAQELEALRKSRRKLKAALATLRTEAAQAAEENATLHRERESIAAQYTAMAARLEKAVAEQSRESAGLRQALADSAREADRLRHAQRESADHAEASRARDRQAHHDELSALTTRLAASDTQCRQQADRLRELEMRGVVEERLRPVLDSAHSIVMQAEREGRSSHHAVLQQGGAGGADAGALQEKTRQLEERLEERTAELKTVSEQAKADLVDMSSHLKRMGEAKLRVEELNSELKVRLAEAEQQVEAVQERQGLALDVLQHKEEARLLRAQLEEEKRERKEMDHHRRSHHHHHHPHPPHPGTPTQAPVSPQIAAAAAPSSVPQQPSESEAAVDALQAQVASLQAAVQQRESALRAAESHLRMQQQQLQEGEVARAERMSENNRLVAKVSALEAARRAEQAQRASLEEEHSALQRQSDAREAEAAQLRRERNALEQSELHLRGIAKNLEHTLSTVVEDRDGGAPMDDGDDEVLVRWRKEYPELLDLRMKAKHLAAENAELREKAERLVGQGEEGAALRAKLKAVEGQLASRDADHRRAREGDAAAILELRHTAEGLRGEVARLQGDNSQLERTVTAIQSEADAFEAQAEQDAAHQLAALKQQRDAAVRAQEELQRDVQQLREDLASAASQLQSQGEALRQCEEESRRLRQGVSGGEAAMTHDFIEQVAHGLSAQLAAQQQQQQQQPGGSHQQQRALPPVRLADLLPAGSAPLSVRSGSPVAGAPSRGHSAPSSRSHSPDLGHPHLTVSAAASTVSSASSSRRLDLKGAFIR